MPDEKLSLHFMRSEFACRCGCGFDDVEMKLVYALEALRERFGAPVTINSGCRCEEYNEKIGGVANSRHLRGDAADVVVSNVAPDEVADYCDQLIGDHGGVGRYNAFTHVDARGERARWSG